MTNILVVGTHQCGSTRLFNLIRLVYEKNGMSVLSKWNLNLDEIQSTQFDIKVGKIHNTSLEYLNHFNIVLLPLRNVIDAAVSAKVRLRKDYQSSCLENIEIFNKFKNKSQFIFKYEDYSVAYIKSLCSLLKVSLSTIEIIKIMKELDNQHQSKKIVRKDNHNNPIYRKTLLSQSHNTSNGKCNKYTCLPEKELIRLLNNKHICSFLEEHGYI